MESKIISDSWTPGTATSVSVKAVQSVQTCIISAEISNVPTQIMACSSLEGCIRNCLMYHVELTHVVYEML